MRAPLPYRAGAAVLAAQVVAACTTPALFTLQPPTIVHPPSPQEPPAQVADGGAAMDATAPADVETSTPPAQVFGPAVICARLAALTCEDGLSENCATDVAPHVDATCVLSATTVDEVRRCRGVVCP